MEVDSDEEALHARRERSRFCEMSGDVCNEFVELQNAFRGTLKTFYLRHGHNALFKDICMILTNNKDKMSVLIRELLSDYGVLKFNIVTECTYIRPHTEETQIRTFKTKNQTVFQNSCIDDILHNMFQKICKEESEYVGKGSGWSLYSVDGVLLRFSRYRPLGGSTYLPLPKRIAAKHSIINPKNYNNNHCFQWAILARYVNSPVVDNKYLLLRNKFNFDGITFPTPIKQIGKFEKLNPGVSVNVYSLDKDNLVYPLRVCDEEKPNHFDLLFLTSSIGVNHYCYIKHFSRLVNTQVTKHTSKSVFCKRCFNHYQGSDREIKLKNHMKDCSTNKPVRVVMPSNNDIEITESPTLKFKNFQYSYKVPIVIYADFECLLTKVNKKVTKKTFVKNKHEPMSFGIYVVVDDSLPQDVARFLPKEPYIYRGRNAAEKFMNYLIILANLAGDLVKTNIPINTLSVEEQLRYETATHCELCNCEFTMIHPAVRDHCPYTGCFRSVLCNSCNLIRQKQRFLPVFIHGSSNYDSHFIVRQLGCDEHDINVIPNTSEKYLSFTKRTSSGISLRFIDTFRFMDASLSDLAKNLPRDHFVHTKKFFLEDDLSLVTRKGVYPYEFTDSWEKLNICYLPPKKYFYKGLGNSNMCDPENETANLDDSLISDEDYSHASNVWTHFNCQTLGEYSDLYLKVDVLLLCDTFENFRSLCMSNYDLDCAHYLSLPGFTFDAMLKFTEIELDLFTNYDMYLFIEQSIRGGITSCVKRYAKSNNHLLKEKYDPNIKSSYLTYIDSNNLYGFAMSMPIPQNSFKWKTNQLESFDVTQIPDDSSVGYILEVDIAYPQYLHEAHNDLPFLPENKRPPNSKQNKLLTTLEHKKHYVCHYMNLKQAMRNGLVLQKIHRVLEFNQSKWLKPYIDLNTSKRQTAKNRFEEDLYKKMNNAMFGKTIENIRKRSNLELVNSEKRLNKLISKPSFLERIIYDENLSAVSCSKESIFFNKPIYIGFTVLELSKHLMYNHHYNVMKKFYGSKIKLLYIDTDSFFYEICTEDFYSDMLRPELRKHFDTSNYPSDHPCFSNCNKMVLGKFKDECKSRLVLEFVGLRPKLYCFVFFDDNDEMNVQKKAKGVTKCVVDKCISIDDYKNCLFNNDKIVKSVTRFQSKKHEVQTVTVEKLAMSANDDKRFVCNDGIKTLAYGHYLLS